MWQERALIRRVTESLRGKRSLRGEVGAGPVPRGSMWLQTPLKQSDARPRYQQNALRDQTPWRELVVSDDHNGLKESPQESEPVADLEHLKRRLAEERCREEMKLPAFGRIETHLDLTIAAYRLADTAGVSLDEERWPGITTIPHTWLSQFNRDFPPSHDPAEALNRHMITNTTAGSAAYSMIVDSVNHFEEPATYSEYERVKQGFEDIWESENLTDEVTRRLAWISEQAAAKFKAAWEALDAGIPPTDPTSGPALAMRSALDLTVKALLKRTCEPRPREKAKYLVHIARQSARNAEAAKLLSNRASVYKDLTDRLSRSKGTTEGDRRALRTLFFKAQQLLYLIVESIDPTRLLPK